MWRLVVIHILDFGNIHYILISIFFVLHLSELDLDPFALLASHDENPAIYDILLLVDFLEEGFEWFALGSVVYFLL